MKVNLFKKNISLKIFPVLITGLAVMLFSNKALGEPVFILKPAFSISEVYDDNLFSNRTGKDWDIYTEINPALEAELSLRSMDLFAGYSPRFLLFPKHFNNENVNAIFHDAYFEGKTEFAGGLMLGVKNRYYYLPITYTQADFSPSNVDSTNEARFFSKYNLGLSQTVDLDTSMDFTRFDSATQSASGMLTNGKISMVKSFNSILKIGLVNRVTKYWYDDLENNPFIFAIGLKPQVYLTPHIKGSFPFGYRYLVLNQSDNENSFTYRITLDYEKNDEVIASVFYGQEFLVDLTGNNFDTWTLGATVNYDVVERFWVNVSAYYNVYRDKSLPEGANTTKILAVNPSIEYELGRDFSLSVGYNGFFNKWGNASGGFINNRVFIMFGYKKNRQ